MTDPKSDLARALALENETERKLAVIGAVSSALADLGARPVIVGGLAVEYWTYGAYSTTDIDVLLPSSPEIGARLAELGFERRGRHWVLEGEEMFLEAPGSSLGTGEEAVEVDLGEGRTVSVLRPEDVLIYRLHEFVGTGHREAASQSVSLLQSEHLDVERLERRAAEERLSEALTAMGDLADRIANGDTIGTAELHELARELARTM